MADEPNTIKNRFRAAKLQVDDLKRRMARITDIVMDNPIGMAIGCVAVGFLLGLIVPKTTMESERIAPLAADMKHRAVAAAEEIIRRGTRAVRETAQAAMGAARERDQHGSL